MVPWMPIEYGMEGRCNTNNEALDLLNMPGTVMVDSPLPPIPLQGHAAWGILSSKSVTIPGKYIKHFLND